MKKWELTRLRMKMMGSNFKIYGAPNEPRVVSVSLYCASAVMSPLCVQYTEI